MNFVAFFIVGAQQSSIVSSLTSYYLQLLQEDIRRSFNMIQQMGGSILKEMSSRVTHLIADICTGDKYR